MLKQKTPLKAKKGLQARGKGVRTKPTLKPLNKLLKDADAAFSKYIRIRDSERVGDAWIGKCITCSYTKNVAFYDTTGTLRFIKGWDNGHFIGRGTYITRFEEENCNLQCLTQESNVHLSDGYTKRIRDIIVGDSIMAFDETSYKPKTAIVKHNVPLTSKSLFKVKLQDGTVFKGTGDHRVLCEVDGVINWYYLEDISNMLHTGTVCNIITV